MKISLKKCVCLLFILILSASFTACHASKKLDEFEVPESFNTSKNYEITFWAKNDTNVTQTNIYKNAIKEFENLYPNITVNLKLYTEYGRIYSDVITNIATNTTPNVCVTYPDHIVTYMSGENTVVPLDSLMNNEKYGLGGSELLYDSPTKDEMITKYLDECMIKGSHYAIPFMRSTEACYINKSFVEKLGYEVPDILTWDFIWEVSEAATKKDGNDTFLLNNQNVMIPFIYKSTDNMMIQLLHQLDAGYSTANGEIEIFNETTTDLLYDISAHTKNGAFSTFKISSYPANFLNAGQCVFAIDSTAGSTWMGPEAPLSDISEDSFVDFDIVVRAIPQYDTERPSMISQGPSITIFNKADTDEVLASWLFAQYLITNEVEIPYAATEGYVPVTLKAQNSIEYQEYLAAAGSDDDLHYSIKLDATRLLLDNIDNTFITPVFNGSASLRDASGNLIESVAKSTRRKQTIDSDYMDKLFTDVTSLYHLDEIVSDAYGKKSFDALPKESIILLSGLATTWVLILVYIVIEAFKRKNRREK